MDEFEAQLKRQPLRPVPREWRREILEAARPQPSAGASQVAWNWLREWLWPAPQAWAGLAAAWMLALVLELASSSQMEGMTMEARISPPLREVVVAFLEQRRLRAEFLELAPGAPPSPAEAPRPRSQRHTPCAVA